LGKPLVYLAGPYSHPDPVLNVRYCIGVGDDLLAEGDVVPLVPHLTLLWHFVRPRPIDDWYTYDIALLARCDAVLRLPGDSVGADAEIEFALATGIPG
jgi:nucleoside 2-deoxyribosyltransferase